MKIDYQKYHFSFGERIRFIAEGVGLCVIVNYLCFREVLIAVLMMPMVILYLKRKRKELVRKRIEMLGIQFKDAIHSLQVAISAGYSMENAVIACVDDLKGIYESHEPIVQEFEYFKKQISISVPIEALFMDLGNRSQVEDIQNFASICAIAKRSGGDLNAILNKTARMIEEKIETGKEISASIAAKRMEQLIMSVVPCGIILYVQLTSPGYMDVLYGNAIGIAVMSGCLLLYMVSFYLGKKMMEIEV